MRLIRKCSVLAAAGTLAALLAAPAFAGDVTPDRLVNSELEPQNWLNHHGNYETHRFSGLKQINTRNVKNLKVAFTYAMGDTHGGGNDPVKYRLSGLEGTPLAEDGFLYITTGWGRVTKLDVRRGRAEYVWDSDPEADPDWAPSVTCCGINNRGVALHGNMVLAPVIDGRIRALSKDDGSLIWETQVGDPGIAEVITGAPLVVNNLVLTGMAGAEFGVRGWISALDVKTGKEVWRTHTIPAPGEPGNETWKDNIEAWKTGGGSTWVTGSYDPKLNLIYWGTANPGPDWDSSYRPGDNLWTDSTIAIKADTGEFVWGFQHTPNDPYDYDSISEKTLVDTKIFGKPRRVVLHADRNGYAYALDRVDGSFIWGTQFVDHLNWTDGLDENGRPNSYDPNVDVQLYAPGTAANRGETTKVGEKGTIEGKLCPTHAGGKNWPPTAYSPQTNYYYIPVIEGCNKALTEVAKPNWDPADRQWFLGGYPYQTFGDPDPEVAHLPFGRWSGSVAAIDVSTGKIVGKYRTFHPQMGGLLATAGGLVFTGNLEGVVVALDAKTLQELWRFDVGAGITAPPMTFSAGGKQYVAIEVGYGGAAEHWQNDIFPEMWKSKTPNVLYVFSL
jgi:alcohol dehydrogenase (cytochrome c)